MSLAARILLCCSLVAVMPSPAQEAAGPLITAELRAGVERGLAFLAKHQNRDGSFGVSVRDRGSHLGVTAIAGMAFLAGGHLPGRRVHGDASRRCLQAILSAQHARSGLIVNERTISRPMYSHAFATLYLAQVHGMAGDSDLGPPLRRAVDAIVAAQGTQGGWRYTSPASSADLSVTACQVSALRAARNAGVGVPGVVIDRALAYVLRCRNPDGSFRYQDDWGHASPHLTAAAITCLQQLGEARRPEVQAAFRWLAPYFPAGQRRLPGHVLYGQFYMLQAAYQDGPERFRAWYPRFRDRFLKAQRKDGAFDAPAIGELYGSAMALLLLQLPYHFLPMLLR